MKQHRQRNGQEGIAMIIVVCIMAVLVMMSLALLLASSVMTQNAGRVKDQEQSRILAVSLADELEKELTVAPSQQECWHYLRICQQQDHFRKLAIW